LNKDKDIVILGRGPSVNRFYFPPEDYVIFSVNEAYRKYKHPVDMVVTYEEHEKRLGKRLPPHLVDKFTVYTKSEIVRRDLSNLGTLNVLLSDILMNNHGKRVILQGVDFSGKRTRWAAEYQEMARTVMRFLVNQNIVYYTSPILKEMIGNFEHMYYLDLTVVK